MMMQDTVRPALTTAILWIGAGVFGRAEASGIVLSTPTGLSPGDTFRFAFVTDGTTDATSSNIAVYNAFVNAQAGDATYNGAVVSWDAIGSTSTVNAIDNVGQTLTPVYLADGSLVTTSTTSSGLWSGFLLDPIDEDLSDSVESGIAWTGSQDSGIGYAPEQLGNYAAIIGQTDSTDLTWVTNGGLPTLDYSFAMYGISQVLAVQSAVPEPATLLMTGTAVIASCAFGWSRGLRRKHRQRKPAQPRATG